MDFAKLDRQTTFLFKLKHWHLQTFLMESTTASIILPWSGIIPLLFWFKRHWVMSPVQCVTWLYNAKSWDALHLEWTGTSLSLNIVNFFACLIFLMIDNLCNKPTTDYVQQFLMFQYLNKTCWENFLAYCIFYVFGKYTYKKRKSFPVHWPTR